MQKLLFIGTSFHNLRGGAEKSIFRLLSSISREYNIEAVIFNNFKENKSYKLNYIMFHNYSIKLLPYFKYLTLFLNHFRIKKILNSYKQFDIFISQTFGGAYYLRLMKKIKPNIKTIYFVRDEVDLNIIKNYEVGFKKIYDKILNFIQFFFIYIYKRQNKFCLFNSDRIIANSMFIQNLISKLFGLKSTIIYPILDIKRNLPKNIEKRRYITMIHSTPHKGVNIFLKIAKEFSNEKYCVYGSYPLKKKPQNVIFYKWTNRANLIYNRTKLILIPSIWMEAFCRVSVEAACNFIPVISSNRGGLIESNVNGTFVNNDINNTDIWLKKIKEILSNYSFYVNKIDLSKFDKFKKECQIRKFKEVLLELN